MKDPFKGKASDITMGTLEGLRRAGEGSQDPGQSKIITTGQPGNYRVYE